MEMNSIPCDIVLLPGAELAQKAITLSRQLEQHGSRFILKDGVYFPHVSLYMAQLRRDDLEKIKIALASIAAASISELTATKYYQSHGYIDIEYMRTDSLDALQVATIKAINPLREGVLENDKARMQKATGQTLDNFTKYGYPAVGGLFRPHLTFTRFITDAPIPTDTLPQPREFSGSFPKLGLFEMDSNNACVRKLTEFEFTAAA